ncbi:peptide-methionine (S)-S-oxide reductase MsrA [Cobetia marina]|jgi:peptide-methionine (S)-S-oxide reductase|uniref:peptide-methionine (S)-S-oxide reductase MsrA n=1 Tax=Cobetia TaxID=204286 RepID=UPI0008655C01|nr:MULTISPECIES: peptide-methionine (S)-S-oxide reductase MsrA [Cobetia]AOM01425.1 peptide-methionine (S)-S-oxide reductase [Cobetia marina]AZV31346.1 peptide-methionine (S)-S-oxide reductase MsrA [Cobetia sp. ICG0124]MDA5563429.1 peptide-methionine (S)-S-oxide reductase MsrA [Cobetia sp. MMG027]TKD63889.1 peptide-methionine (S)-S-oxide reductase MsrA [Cobetia marina]GED40937.1 peptide methionine sulfoxide reductase MsrA [Cobetia marina]
MWKTQDKQAIPSAEDALPGREQPLQIMGTHHVNGRSIVPPYPQGCEEIVLGLGCFWGAERLFWQLPGVVVTAVGYAGGHTPNPTYEETCTGKTGHTEVVRVVFDPTVIGLPEILRASFEAHDPTQGMRQGNDIGSQYRSAIYYVDDAQREIVEKSLADYQQALNQSGLGRITTEIAPLETFYYAEDFHQQYLAKNPGGYCGLKGTGISCPIG